MRSKLVQLAPVTSKAYWKFYLPPFHYRLGPSEVVVGAPPDTRSTVLNPAACYAHMGRFDEARAIVARLRAISPQVVPSDDALWRNPEDRELLLLGLRLAAGETA